MRPWGQSLAWWGEVKEEKGEIKGEKEGKEREGRERGSTFLVSMASLGKPLTICCPSYLSRFLH